jgi:hypothetical protein
MNASHEGLSIRQAEGVPTLEKFKNPCERRAESTQAGIGARVGLAKLHAWPVKISTTIHGREKKKKRPNGRSFVRSPV